MLGAVRPACPACPTCIAELKPIRAFPRLQRDEHARHTGQARSPKGTGRSLYKTWRPR